jgi:hypothetical protein
MIENLEYKGEWFLPSDKTKRVSGTLYYDVDKGIKLELFGDFNKILIVPTSELVENDIILGITTQSEEITLYKTFVSSRSDVRLVKNQEMGLPSTTYGVKYLFEGVHFDKSEDIKFDKILVSAFLLETGFDKNILNQMLDDKKHRFFHFLANW